MTPNITEKSVIEDASEQVLTLHGVSWQQLEAVDSALEGVPGVRLAYLDGTLEIMAPISEEHEDYKSIIGLLLEAYLYEMGIRFYCRGGPTLGSKAIGVRREPDESYNLGSKKAVPDIAIEVVITSGGINKLASYKRLSIPEVWFWEDGQLSIYHLGEQDYNRISKSEFLADLDLSLLVRYANMSDQYDAVTEFRNAIRASRSQ